MFVTVDHPTQVQSHGDIPMQKHLIRWDTASFGQVLQLRTLLCKEVMLPMHLLKYHLPNIHYTPVSTIRSENGGGNANTTQTYQTATSCAHRRPSKDTQNHHIFGPPSYTTSLHRRLGLNLLLMNKASIMANSGVRKCCFFNKLMILHVVWQTRMTQQC